MLRPRNKQGKRMAVVITGAGLVATAYAREAIARGEEVVFIDPEPRADYLRFKLGERGWKLLRSTPLA